MHFNPPKVGVGLVYTPAIERFLQSAIVNDLYNALEVEPQTMWLAEHPINGPFSIYEPAFAKLSQRCSKTLVHSVGMPLGGERAPSKAQLKTLKTFCDRLDPPWVSEHLSVAGTPHKSAGFLLPPLQTDENVDVTCRNIELLTGAIDRPLAIETGVAYVRRKSFEMDDGEHLARIVEQSGCGILLDINNLYCNHKNGRIRIHEYLDQIPLQSVWEVHLAGSDEINGFTVDAHNGRMNDEQRELAQEIISKLPNLGAITCEVYGTFLESMKESDFVSIVEDAKHLWDSVDNGYPSERPPTKDNVMQHSESMARPLTVNANKSDAKQWEESMTHCTITGDTDQLLFADDEPAIKLYGMLARSFRASLLMRNLPRAFRYLMLGEFELEKLLTDYFKSYAPQIYGPLEAAMFRSWVADGSDDHTLLSLIDYDIAIMDSKLKNQSKTVSFKCDPRELFEALSNNEFPHSITNGTNWDIEIVPD